jgi:hypothetical protein
LIDSNDFEIIHVRASRGECRFTVRDLPSGVERTAAPLPNEPRRAFVRRLMGEILEEIRAGRKDPCGPRGT